MSADPVDVVRQGYDLVGEAYSAWSSSSPVRLRYVERLLHRLPRGSRVVDLGCGAGEPTTRMLAARHQVLGVDLSSLQVARARRAAPTAAFAVADMTSFALRPDSVDAVVSLYTLVHTPPDRHRPLLAAMSQWLRPGGLVLINAPVGAEHGVQERWLGVPMYFGGIGEEATISAVTGAGLRVDSAERVSEDEGKPEAVDFLWIVAEKERVDHGGPRPAQQGHALPAGRTPQ